MMLSLGKITKQISTKRIKIVIGFVLMLSLLDVYGQQDPQYTQYMYNMNVLNPAYAGSKGTLSIGLLGRTQWVRLEGAPKTLTASINAPIGQNIGLGLSVIADEIGPAKEQNVYGDFSYTIYFSRETKLSLGLKAGVTFLDVKRLRYLDPTYDLNEPFNRVSPNLGAGAFYHSDKFYMGFSVPNLLETRHMEESEGKISTASERMHYFLTSGYIFELSRTLKLKPSIMIKAVNGAPVSADFSGNVLLNNRLEFGLSYRLDESVSALVNIAISPAFRLGYAYDHTLTNLGNFNSGSHEVILLFDFDLYRGSILSPRFF